MTLQEMTDQVASNIDYIDENNAVIDDSDINRIDIHNWLNNRYRYEVVPAYSKRRPERYTVTTIERNWDDSGAISSISGTTLTATTQIFEQDMLDARVFNSTRGSTQRINSFSTGTEVTLDAEPSDWVAGDTIYIFSGLFSLGGDAHDVMDIYKVGIRYNSTDKKFRRCRREEDKDLFSSYWGQEADDALSQFAPTYVPESMVEEDKTVPAVKIRPFNWTVAFERAVEIKYTQMPAKMENDEDEPVLPQEYHGLLVYGALADAYRKLKMFDVAAEYDNSRGLPWIGTGSYNVNFKALLSKQTTERKRRFIHTRSANRHYGRR